MKALRYAAFGAPLEVAELVDEPAPALPTPTQVTVQAVCMPVHPADLLAMEGRYGARRPSLPAYGGTDGVGRVTAVGAQVTQLRVGDLVPLMFAGVATWREAFTVEADRLFALPPGDPLPMAAVGVNVLTAWALLHTMAELPPDAWVIQNAAASAVGHACVQLGARAGLRTINVVRNDAEAARLQGISASHVLRDGPGLAVQVRQLTGGALPALAIDAVGGDATERLASCTAAGGQVVNYGLLSGEAPRIASADLLFRQVALRGFWLKAWLRGIDMARLRAVYDELAQLAQDGAVSTPVAATYALADYRAALAHAASYTRDGKVLFVGVDQVPRVVVQDEASQVSPA